MDIRGTDLSACLLEGCNLTLARYDKKTRVPAGFDLEKSGAVGPGAALNGAFLNGADLRGMDLGGTVATEIAVAEVVGEDDDDVGFGGRFLG